MKSSTVKQNRFRAKYGPWAVVTGASSGIGREISWGLAESGLNLVLVARNRNRLEQVATDVSAKYGVETRIIEVDLAEESAIDAVEIGVRNLDVGLLVAAAGFGTSGPFLDAKLEQEINMLYVNCRALMSLTLRFGRQFANRGRGGIILMSSIVGFQGTPNSAHYAATKAYVQSLAEALDVELSPLGIDVLASAPGPVHSSFAARAGMQMGMALKPKDIAQPTLDALGNRSTARPGLLSKLIPFSLGFVPRWVRVRIMGTVMKGMTKHRLRMPQPMLEK